MKVLFPDGLDFENVLPTRESRNATQPVNRFELDDVICILAELEARVGVKNSTDQNSLAYMIAQIQTAPAIPAAVLPSFALDDLTDVVLTAPALGDFLTFNGTNWINSASSVAAHALLSASHSDTLAGSVARGDLIVGNSTPKWARLAIGSANKFVGSDGTDTSWTTVTAAMIGSGAALTKTDDTNVTLTLGGTPTTALLAATSITAGWTGQLGLTRGGTAASLTADNGGIIYSTASAFAVMGSTATAGLALISGASTTPTWFAPTAGSILFAGTAGILSQDNANFFYDSTNHRLTIGIATSSRQLRLYQSNSTVASSPQFTIDQNSSGDAAMQFEIIGVQAWNVGIDHSDTSAFKISSAGDDFTASRLTIDVSGGITLTQKVGTTGSPTHLTVTSAAHTTLSNAEAIDVNFNLARTVQFSGNAVLATQRAFLIQAPTYSSDTSSKTITTSSTLTISGAPVAGTNVSLTTNYSLWSQGGRVFFDSGVSGLTNAWKFFKIGSQNVSLGTTLNNSTVGVLFLESHAPTTGTYGFYSENHVTNSSFVTGAHFQAWADATSGTNANVEGLGISAVGHGAGQTLTLIEALYAEAICDHTSGTITLGTASSIWSRITLNSAGTVTATTVYGILIDPTIGANTTITNMYGMKIGAVSNGTITTGYGLYIDTVRGTTNYGIYQASTSNNNFFAGKFSTYNNITTVSNGMASELATIDSTALTANVGATTLYAVPASGVGMYRVSAYVVLTTAASISSTLPNVQLVYTDSDSNTSVTLDVTPILGAAGSGQTGALTANTVGTVSCDVKVIYVKASTTIQYKTVNYASSLAGMAYALRIKLEAL